MNVNDEYHLEKSKYNRYICKARIGTLEELLTQSQAREHILELKSLEGENDLVEINLLEIGRENIKELVVENGND